MKYFSFIMDINGVHSESEHDTVNEAKIRCRQLADRCHFQDNERMEIDCCYTVTKCVSVKQALNDALEVNSHFIS